MDEIKVGDDAKWEPMWVNANKHLIMVGRSGLGKSKLLLLMILQMIFFSRRSFALFDLHGDLCEEVVCMVDASNDQEAKDKLTYLKPPFRSILGLAVIRKKDRIDG